jgi:hypothetical protein
MTPEVTKTVLNKIILLRLDRKWTNIIIWPRYRASISVQQLRIKNVPSCKKVFDLFWIMSQGNHFSDDSWYESSGDKLPIPKEGFLPAGKTSSLHNNYYYYLILYYSWVFFSAALENWYQFAIGSSLNNNVFCYRGVIKVLKAAVI